MSLVHAIVTTAAACSIAFLVCVVMTASTAVMDSAPPTAASGISTSSLLYVCSGSIVVSKFVGRLGIQVLQGI